MKDYFVWEPSDSIIADSNIHAMMTKQQLSDFKSFRLWASHERASFWAATVDALDIKMHKNYDNILDLSNGPKKANWLAGAELNIVDSCFKRADNDVALIFQKEGGALEKITQKELEKLVNRIANSLINAGLKTGDVIAIDMPMTLEAVAIYLAGIKAGMPIATIADSFTEKEIAVRINITNPKLVFTQDVISRAGKTLPLYTKLVEANAPKTVVISTVKNAVTLRPNDIVWHDFLTQNTLFESVKQSPDNTITILFSSGTTGAPKSIPWTHTTPIKGASDGYYHHNIKEGDVVCWPTNLGWMMGPWLVFAALINKASIALYYGAPLDQAFGQFVQNAQVTMLGVVPSIVRHWKNSQCIEGLNWQTITCFSSTGEVSNPDEMSYLMQLGGGKPVIEYCGGTEIGGGYITSTMVQTNYPSQFSCEALGGDFVLLDEDNQPSNQGEVYIIPPVMGLSNTLLNKDHEAVYYKDTPTLNGQILRRHGDAMNRLKNGYYVAQGRVDDAMNLGGIKVSSIQIEELINSLDFVKESAAIAVNPPEGGPSLLVIYYVPSSQIKSAQESLNAAKQIIRTQLNPLFKVTDLVAIDQLPRTASGKVMRRNLRNTYNNS